MRGARSWACRSRCSGCVFFVVAIALCLPPIWRSRGAWLDAARLGWLTVGLGMALYLVWAELYRINAICLWCTAVHAITFALWIVVLFGQILSGPARRPRLSGPRAERCGRLTDHDDEVSPAGR